LGRAVEVINQLLQVYADSIEHDGFADIRVEIKILKRGQKEVIIHSGKQYRFIVDVEGMPNSVVKELNEYQLVPKAELEVLRNKQVRSFVLSR
jgi:hypothetical protein